jgi:long-chain acyl-CoA synthetase
MKQNGKSFDGSLEQMAEDEDVHAFIKKELISTAQKGGLKGPEIIQDIVVIGELFTPENGMLTAANKLNRSVIVKKYDKEIKVRMGA